jgi:hypothetical protein
MQRSSSSVVFLLAPTLALALTVEAPLVTVEAEYGSTVVRGALHTAAHHQGPDQPEFHGRHAGGTAPSPCCDPAVPVLSGASLCDRPVVLLSHLDLDSVGGALRTLAEFQDLFASSLQSFWRLVEFVDVNGPHKLVVDDSQVVFTQVNVDRIRAYWAWARSQPRQPRDSVSDVTQQVVASGLALRMILGGDVDLLESGRAAERERRAVNVETFHSFRIVGSVGLRRVADAKAFVNDLYVAPHGTPLRAVVTLNDATGAVTLSLADAIPGVSCRAVAQALWGSEAGGHDGIAGSPRGSRMTHDDWFDAANALGDAVESALNQARHPPLTPRLIDPSA